MASTRTAPTWERTDSAPGGDPVWRKAPVLLARTPTVLAATLLAAALVAAAAASGPLFESSARQAALAEEVAALDPDAAGFSVTAPVEPDAAVLRMSTEQLGAVVAERAEDLGAVQLGLRTSPVTLAVADEPRVRLRGGAAAPDTPPEAAGDGLWLPATLADEVGLEAGDSATLVSGGDQVTVPVAGVAPLATEGEYPEPLLADVDALAGVVDDLGLGADATWTFPLERPPADVAGAAAAVAALARDVADERTEAGAAVSDVVAHRTRLTTSAGLPDAARRVEEAVAAFTPPVRSLWTAATLAALAIVGGAAVLRGRQRAGEQRLATTRGLGPLRQALQAGVESLPVLAGGVALGWVVAITVVGGAGPTAGGAGALSGAAATAALWAAVAGLAGLAVITAVTGLGVRGGMLAPRAQRALAKVPWEAVALGLAAVAGYQLRLGGSALLDARGEVARVDGLVLAFPVLLLVGTVALAVRLLGALAPRLRHVGLAASPSRWLALRRLAAAPWSALALTGSAALAMGLLAAAATLSSSAETTAEAKAGVTVGAAAAAPLPGGDVDAVDGTTVVFRGEGRLEPGDDRGDLLVVDPGTFADVAAWHPGFADEDLLALLATIDVDADDAPVPALLVAGDTDPTLLRGSGFDVAVDVRGTAAAFPGQSAARPLLVVAREPLEAAIAATDGRPLPAAAQPEVWGVDAAAVATVAGEGDGEPAAVTTAAAAAQEPALRAAGWTLGYLQALAVAAGLLALAAVVLALTERQRAREVAFALAVRMGLTRTAHRRAVAVELALLLAVALLLGGSVGVAAATLTVPALDPEPALPPAPLLSVPIGLLATAAAVLAATVAVGAWLVQRAADRARVAEVLRDA